jgi:hypothetical protein
MFIITFAKPLVFYLEAYQTNPIHAHLVSTRFILLSFFHLMLDLSSGLSLYDSPPDLVNTYHPSLPAL